MAKANAKQKTPTIQLGDATGGRFRAGSARALYYKRMLDYIGLPLADFVASVTENPPSMPTKGKLAGKAEPVQGWVNFLVRNRYFIVA